MIIISDIHLGKTNDSIVLPEGLSQTLDTKKRLDFILDRAKTSGQSVVVAGDIFNRMNPTTQIMSVFFEWLSSCSRDGVNVYIIPGNHDGGVDWTSMMMLQKVDLHGITVVVSPAIWEIEERPMPKKSELVSRSVLFIPHVPAVVSDSAEKDFGSFTGYVSSVYPHADFIIGHGTIGVDYSNDIFFEAGNALKIDPSLFSDLKLMVLGHILEV